MFSKITMLLKTSNYNAFLKVFTNSSITVILILVISTNISKATDRTLDAQKSKKDSSEVFLAVEKPAEYSGGQMALSKYLQHNVIKPLSSIGLNNAHLRFIVNTDGSTSDFSISTAIDKKVPLFIENFPALKPAYQTGKAVRSWFIITLHSEMLQEDNEVQNKLIPLIILNKVETPATKLKKFSLNTLEKIVIMNDKKTLEKYGDKGKNGVVIITTKKK